MPTGSFRGGIQVGNTLYGAWTNEVVSVNSDGELIAIAVPTLTGTDRIHIARNNAATPIIAIVTDLGAFQLDTSTGTVSSYPDADVGSPSCVCSHTGYFMFGYGTGLIQASDLNSTNINTLNAASTETNPDGVVEIISFQGKLWVFGTKTIEIWGDPINDTGFPLTRVGYNITPGIYGPFCVTGSEPEFGNAPIYIASDNTVRQLDGYNSVKISPPDLDRLIASVLEIDSDQMEAICYVAGGHAFCQINGPTFSWVYNCNNQRWHERRSYLSTRSNFTRSVNAFNRWLVGSTENSDLLHIRHDVYTEAGDPIVARMESQNVTDFPNRVACHRADFNFVPGIGIASGEDPIEIDPQVLIEWSDDGGQSFKGPWWRAIGKQDITDQRVTVLNTGMAASIGRRWRWTISDPVYVGFTGSTMEPEVRSK